METFQLLLHGALSVAWLLACLRPWAPLCALAEQNLDLASVSRIIQGSAVVFASFLTSFYPRETGFWSPWSALFIILRYGKCGILGSRGVPLQAWQMEPSRWFHLPCSESCSCVLTYGSLRKHEAGNSMLCSRWVSWIGNCRIQVRLGWVFPIPLARKGLRAAQVRTWATRGSCG